MSQHKLLRLNISSKLALSTFYMPFIKDGGLFIPGEYDVRLGSTVCMLLRCWNVELFVITGSVVWITPAQAQGGRSQGIGVRFKWPTGHTRTQLETHLTESGNSDIKSFPRLTL